MSGGAAKAPAQWLRKDEAAKLLGVSVRQIERREHQGRIRKRYAEAAGHPAPVEYSREDLLALKAGKPNSYGRVMKKRAPVARSGNSEASIHGETVPLPVSNDPVIEAAADPAAESSALVPTAPGAVALRDAGLAALLAKLAAAFPTPAPELPPWLDLKEAAKYSGLPAHFLLDCARAGARFARNCGSERHAIWRFNRKELAK